MPRAIITYPSGAYEACKSLGRHHGSILVAGGATVSYVATLPTGIDWLPDGASWRYMTPGEIEARDDAQMSASITTTIQTTAQQIIQLHAANGLTIQPTWRETISMWNTWKASLNDPAQHPVATAYLHLLGLYGELTGEDGGTWAQVVHIASQP